LAVEVDADCSRFPLEWLFHFRWGKKPGKISGENTSLICISWHIVPFYRSLKKQLRLEQIVVSILTVGYFIHGKRSLTRLLLMVCFLTLL